MPKVGGIAMALGAVVPILIWSPANRFVNALLLGAGVLVVFGFLDDIKEMDYRGKLCGQIAAALIVTGYGGLSVSCMGECLPGIVLPQWIALPLTLVVIVGVTNAINLSDGLDGLAGGISMMIFICLGVVAFQHGMTAIALLSVAVIGAIFGFLRFNTHPAIVFMGDAGSQLLGFLAVTLALFISQTSETVSRAFPLVLLGFPILDTLTVMLERMLKGVSPFKADKNHFHHRLMRLGLRHAEAVVAIYALQFCLVMSAFLLRFHSEWTLILLYLAFCGSVLYGFYRADKHQWTMPRNDPLERLIKGKLAVINQRQLLIKACYGVLEVGTPLLLFICCLSLITIPPSVGYVALVLLSVLCIVWLARKPWRTGMLRAALFIMIPYVVFLAHIDVSQQISPRAQLASNLSFGVLAFMAVMTLKFTRRRRGFKANPFDFLIIFTAFIITSIPEIKNTVADVSLITTKMIALLFSFEVLLGETRGKVTKLHIYIVISLATVFIKSVMGMR